MSLRGRTFLAWLLVAYLPLSLATSLGTVLCRDAAGGVTLEVLPENLACHARALRTPPAGRAPALGGDGESCRDLHVGVDVLTAGSVVHPPLPAATTAAVAVPPAVLRAPGVGPAPPSAGPALAVHPAIDTTVLLI